MEQVIFETLRKYPIATQLSRVCENNYKIEKWNLTIEKGVLVIIPISAIHMDPDIYPNPEQFDPSRFSPEEIEKRHSMSFSPFGDGGRSCIGREFGKLMVKLTLIELLR
uniref:Cytochrome P450 n=1 Tax=Megaselia scalaris TaxID=36166 RepID=T1GIH4_MEGSC